MNIITKDGPSLRIIFSNQTRKVFIYVYQCDKARCQKLYLNVQQFNDLCCFYYTDVSLPDDVSISLEKNATGIVIKKKKVTIELTDAFFKEIKPYVSGIMFLLKVRPFPLDLLLDLWLISTWKPENRLLERTVTHYGIPPKFHGVIPLLNIQKPESCFLYQIGMATSYYILDRWPDTPKIWLFADKEPEVFTSLVKLMYKYE